MTNLQDFIHKHVEVIEPLETAAQQAWWNLATTGDEKYALEFQQKQIALRKIYSSSEDYHFLLEQTPHAHGQLKRQAHLLLLRYTENQIPFEFIEEMSKIETEIESIYTNFRSNVDGKSLSNNELKEILVVSCDNKQRQEAWEASKCIGAQVKDKVLRLIELCNHCAKHVGYDNYYSMRLKLQELDEERLFQLIHQLEEATNPPWKRYKAKLDDSFSKRYGIAASDLMPWHYHDPFFQEAPQQELNFDHYYSDKDIVKISQDFYQSIELNVDDIIARSDFYERDKKNQHAFCTCIDRKQDIRILCNIRDNDYWMATQLHELGHAVYDKYINQSLPYLLRVVAHTSVTEAIAMLFGRLSQNSAFLHQHVGIDFAKAQEIEKISQRQTAADLLVFARWALVMVHFERSMYQQPNTDLNKLWWDYVERFQGLKRIPDRDAPDWAAKMHLACAPVYYQNYILGEMMASQLKTYLRSISSDSQTNDCISSQGGNWLKNSIFYSGAELTWNKTLHQATGESVNPLYFVADILNA